MQKGGGLHGKRKEQLSRRVVVVPDLEISGDYETDFHSEVADQSLQVRFSLQKQHG